MKWGSLVGAFIWTASKPWSDSRQCHLILNQRPSTIKLPLFYCHMPRVGGWRVEGTRRSLTPSFCLHQDLMESSRPQTHKWWSWLSISSYRIQIPLFQLTHMTVMDCIFFKESWCQRPNCFAHFKCHHSKTSIGMYCFISQVHYLGPFAFRFELRYDL